MKTTGFALAASLLLGTHASALATEATPDPETGAAVVIENDGGALEGHTPTGFAGMGSGLFAGDNLNPSFPDGVGVQAFLTFALPADLVVGNAQLVSDVLKVSGTPFEDLGPLVAEAVAYEDFGPELFDVEALGPSVECIVSDASSIRCDVTEAVAGALETAREETQFRVRFTTPADGDGSQDLALFYRTDSNTNEAGLFRLEIAE